VRHVKTHDAPVAKAPVSQAVVSNGLVFTSGIVGTDPATGRLEEGISAQARRTLTNVSTILDAAGSRVDHVVKVTIFLRDVADYDAVNDIYREFWASIWPARSTIQAAAPRSDILIEIEVVGELLTHADRS
jgi:2-iminobutanoate/2-iminopropanoate deaminase